MNEENFQNTKIYEVKHNNYYFIKYYAFSLEVCHNL